MLLNAILFIVFGAAAAICSLFLSGVMVNEIIYEGHLSAWGFEMYATAAALVIAPIIYLVTCIIICTRGKHIPIGIVSIASSAVATITTIIVILAFYFYGQA